MENIPQVVGIDVSKRHLDVCIPGARVFRIANDPEGWEALKKVLPTGIPVCLEASGGYERPVLLELTEAGFEVRLVNPRKVLRLADALGHGAKTDVLDARLLSNAGALIECPPAPSAERLKLLEYSRELERLATEVGKLKKQLQNPCRDEFLKGSLRRRIESLTAERKVVQAEFMRLLRASSFWPRYQLLLSVRSIGPETARGLALELSDELEGFTPSQVCSYAGVAPMDSSSGMRIGAKHVRKGNSHLKRALFMAAMSAIYRRAELRTFYKGLLARGKAFQCAIVAVMRKLLREAFAVLRRGSPWQQNPLSP